MDKASIQDIVIMLEESKVPQDVIESVVLLMEKRSYPQVQPEDKTAEAMVRLQIHNESDWRRKAALMASIISSRYE